MGTLGRHAFSFHCLPPLFPGAYLQHMAMLKYFTHTTTCEGGKEEGRRRKEDVEEGTYWPLVLR